MRIEFEIKKLDYRKWCVTLREYFGSQVALHSSEATAFSKADMRASREFHKQYKTTNYKIIFEVKDG